MSRRSNRKGLSIKASIAKARKLSQDGCFAEAFEMLEKIAEYKPAQQELKKLRCIVERHLVGTLLENAQSAIREGRYQDARRVLEQILDVDPNHQQALGLVVDLHILNPNLTEDLSGVPALVPDSVKSLLSRIGSIVGAEPSKFQDTDEGSSSQPGPQVAHNPPEISPVVEASVSDIVPSLEVLERERRGVGTAAVSDPKIEPLSESHLDRKQTPSYKNGPSLPREDAQTLQHQGDRGQDGPMYIRAQEENREATPFAKQMQGSTRGLGIRRPNKESEFQSRGRKRRSSWVAGGAVALILMFIIVFGLSRVASREQPRSTEGGVNRDDRQLPDPPVLVATEKLSEEAPPSVIIPSTKPEETQLPTPESLTIISQPSEAQIFVDGAFAGTSPVGIQIQQDQSLQIKAELDGHQPIVKKLSWSQLTEAERSSRELFFKLRPRIQPGELVVSASYPVRLFIDEIDRGVTTHLSLDPGTYQIRAEAPDVFLKPIRRYVQLGSGETFELPLPPTVLIQIAARPSHCAVSIDGISVGQLPIPRLQVVVGLHRFEFDWPELGRRKSEEIVVRPDKGLIEGVLGSSQ